MKRVLKRHKTFVTPKIGTNRSIWLERRRGVYKYYEREHQAGALTAVAWPRNSK